MSIGKKIFLLGTTIVTLSTLIMLIISQIMLQEDILKSERSYLSLAVKSVDSATNIRRESLYRGITAVTRSDGMQHVIGNPDSAAARRLLLKVTQDFDFIDYAVILDEDDNVITTLRDDLVYDAARFQPILQSKAKRDNKIFFFPEVFKLQELFKENSAAAREFIVIDKQSGEEFQRLLMQTMIIPITDKDSDVIIGKIIVGDIINNDAYFTHYYSGVLEQSYLAISVDGVRVCSNINKDLGESFIGTSVPIKSSIIEQDENYIFGKEVIEKEKHVYLDKFLLNYEGKPVAMVGVGIKEDRFSEILVSNNKNIIIVAFITFALMMLLCKFLSEKISEPISSAIRKAEELERNVIDDVDLQKSDSSDECKRLLDTVDNFAVNLMAYHNQRQEYIKRIETEHMKQRHLSEALRKYNKELERLVRERTGKLELYIRQLQTANSAKTQFLANISHELRTPLNVVIGSAEILQNKIFGELSDKQSEYIVVIRNNAKHLLQLINDILDMSKLEAGKIEMRYSSFLVGDLLRQQVHNLGNLFKEKNLQIEITVQPLDCVIEADMSKLKQILYNLLSNAIKFTPDNGKIDVEVFQLDNYVEFKIKDSGIGIAKENLERIFQEFEQVDNSYSKKYSGTGLGLPLVKRLVELHHGTLSVSSELGKGSEFIFTLPLKNINR